VEVFVLDAGWMYVGQPFLGEYSTINMRMAVVEYVGRTFIDVSMAFVTSFHGIP
jgi:hypothetical protein